MSDGGEDAVRRRNVVADYRKKLLQHKELDSRLRTLRENLRASKKEFTKTEDDLKSLQSVGQIIGEVLRPLDNERCKYKQTTLIIMLTVRPRTARYIPVRQLIGTQTSCYRAVPLKSAIGDRFRLSAVDFDSRRSTDGEVDRRRSTDGEVDLIVKASSGPRYVVGCRSKVDKEKLTAGTRVVLDMTTLTIMRALPREVDPVVYNMLHEDPGNVSYSAVGGLSDQIRELRESIELPLMNPELFLRVGIKPPKVKMIMATNRPDVLDPALLRPGRLDRKIEIPLPNEQSRMEILKIHAAGIAKHGDIDYEAVVKLAEACVFSILDKQAGMSAIRAERDYVIHEDFMKAVRKLNEAKKLESSAHYNADFGKD
ncbi:hypothetical protein BHE74_00024226 [Ensete ventricosum]|nr:hypothetical protein BHE74_00024226 [Ensete ventricosum]